MYSLCQFHLSWSKHLKWTGTNWHGRLKKHCIGLKMYLYILFHQVYTGNQPILEDPNSGKIGRKAKQG